MATPLSRCVRKCMVHPRQLQLHIIPKRTHKFHTKKPRPKPMLRRVFDEITKPIYPKTPIDYMPGSCLDPKKQIEEEPNPYEEFLVRQLAKDVWSSEMFIIAHILPSSRYHRAELQKDYIPDNIKLNVLNNTHLWRLIKDTKLANLKPLLVDSNVYICCTEAKVKEMLAPLKRHREVVILGGYVCGRLVTQQQIKNLAKLPPLEHLLGELVSVLNMAAGQRTLSLLNSHQQRLSSSLEQYRKQLDDDNQ